MTSCMEVNKNLWHANSDCLHVLCMYISLPYIEMIVIMNNFVKFLDFRKIMMFMKGFILKPNGNFQNNSPPPPPILLDQWLQQ